MVELNDLQQKEVEGKQQFNSQHDGTGSGSLLEPDTRLHLWKFATWRFLCRGLNVRQANERDRQLPWIVEARIASPGSKFSKDMRSDIHPRREKITSTASKVGKSLSKSWLILTRKEATSRVCGNFWGRSQNPQTPIWTSLHTLPGASLVAQQVKNLPAMWETWVQSLDWEESLEKEKATYSSILAWRIPWTVESMECKESDMTERLSLSFFSFILYELGYSQWGELYFQKKNRI